MTEATTEAPRRTTPAAGTRPWRPWAGLLAAVLLVGGTALVGRELARGGADLHLIGGYVLRGDWDPLVSPRVLLPAAVGLALLLWAPTAARAARWPVLLAGSAAATAGWAVSLALAGGWGRLTEPLGSRYEYPYDVPRVGGIGELLRTFNDSVLADSADPWTTHVSGHPPGALLAFVLLERAGLGGLGWAAATCIAAGALAVPAVLVTVRAVAGEPAARAVAPFLVLAPTALWVATSADALFAGVFAWGVALLATAAARAAGAAPRALAGGVLLGLALHLSFGLASLGLLALAVVLVHRGRLGWAGVVRVLAVAAAGVLVVFALFALGGYDWFEGLSLTAERVRSGPSYADRPLAFFLVANLAAAAVAAGPASVAGLACLRRSALALLPVAVLAAMLVSDATGLVRGETERIWLPFTVWLPVAAAFLPPRQSRVWLVLSAVTALVVEVAVRTEW
ncbi:hypothetical protein E9529_15690 [Blastococcus sp. KM273128]|uniref:hypothetical protein n=1 Tax=Blastococcus sp. KM273128 TaxID=2570314 RepID=UPI001F43C736|nr:hypothetical protein [Blastococcus sp. KM273128]MCF6745690.1 hypothetical protein [Blastococcus sp. KM273128]